MPVSKNYLDFIFGQMSEFGGYETKRMFGGTNLFRDNLMFAKIKDDSLWLKVDDSNLNDFTDEGMPQYSYGKDNSKKLNFYEVPLEIIEDKNQLANWSKKAFEVAVTAAYKKPL